MSKPSHTISPYIRVQCDWDIDLQLQPQSPPLPPNFEQPLSISNSAHVDVDVDVADADLDEKQQSKQSKLSQSLSIQPSPAVITAKTLPKSTKFWMSSYFFQRDQLDTHADVVIEILGLYLCNGYQLYGMC